MNAQRQSFTQVPPTIGGIQMRPYTAGTSELCADLGITFVNDFSALSKLGEEEAKRQIFLFLFIHGYRTGAVPPEGCNSTNSIKFDIDAMLQAVWMEDKQAFRRQFLIPFGMGINMEEVVPGILAWMTDVNRKTEASLFSIVPKPPRPGEENAPPPPEPPPNS